MKQKSVTMWAIFSPKTKLFFSSSKTSEKKTLDSLAFVLNKKQEDLLKEGYRAFKGKFVWEEK